MTEGIVRIFLSYKEPIDKNLIWMRPYLNKEGYEFLYYGSKGWMPFSNCPHCNNCNEDFNNPKEEDNPCECK